MKKQFVTLGLLLLLLLLTACSGSQDQQQQTIQVTQAPTTQPTEIPTQQATTTQKVPIPSAAELSQLFSAKDGQVTDVNVNPNATGTGVALDIQVYSPTQTKVKHINYLLMQFFFGARNDVSLLNFAFHADGYTGGDDPIAQCGGAASEYSLGDDENQLWTAMECAFNADLPT